MSEHPKRSENAQKKVDRLRTSIDSSQSRSDLPAVKQPASMPPPPPSISAEQLALIPDILDTTIEAIRAMEKAEADNEYTRGCNEATRDEMKQTRDEGQSRERRIYMFNGLTVLTMLVLTVGLWLRIDKLLDMMEENHARTGSPVATGADAGN